MLSNAKLPLLSRKATDALSLAPQSHSHNQELSGELGNAALQIACAAQTENIELELDNEQLNPKDPVQRELARILGSC
jgi:hypothetical protein